MAVNDTKITNTDYDAAAKNQVWQDAMLKDIEAIEKNSTWELVDAPVNKNIVGLKWLFRTKHNADGSIQKHKARLVAKGYSQEQEIDYEEMFSPVARFETAKYLNTSRMKGLSFFNTSFTPDSTKILEPHSICQSPLMKILIAP
ncbi:retrovirus-related pol polyprotein from transposon TNT 1-94 [Tanacetum coccineum]